MKNYNIKSELLKLKSEVYAIKYMILAIADEHIQNSYESQVVDSALCTVFNAVETIKKIDNELAN